MRKQSLGLALLAVAIGCGGAPLVPVMIADTMLMHLEGGKPVPLYLLFGRDATTLSDGAEQLLKSVVRFLEEQPQIRIIEVQGHAAEQGTEAHDDKISEQRAEAVYEYLVSQGIDPSRVSRNGYGSHRPVAYEDDEASHRKNRRVQFVIIDDGR